MTRLPLLALVPLLACVDGGDDEPRGELRVRTEAYGDWTMSPDACFSGERQQFFGVDLSQDGDVADAMRVVLDPIDGYSLLMNIPGEELAIVLGERDGCEVFDLHVERSNTRVNDIWGVFGRARVTCRRPDVEVDADITFEACY